MEPIITQHLILREIIPSDKEHICRYALDGNTLRYMMFAIQTEEEIDTMIRHAAEEAAARDRKEYIFSIETRDTKTFAGTALLEIDAHASSSAEVGYIIIPESQKKGYATEITRALISFGFEHLKLHRIFGKCDEQNTASARVLEKSGMQFEGIMREHIWLKDHWRNSRMYGILSTDKPL
jgi:[ribosomal protein S5]-alanine N-acetyltransferase